MFGDADDADESRLVGDRYYERRAIMALVASPSVQPVRNQPLGGH